MRPPASDRGDAMTTNAVLGRLESLHAGAARTFDSADGGYATALTKAALTGPVLLTADGIPGDEHVHVKAHGGEAKAIHQYPREHYPLWIAEHPEATARFHPGAFGENFSTTGLTEATACVGDVVRVGGAVLELTQPREPCGILTRQFGVANFSRQVQATRRCGWYWRVLEAGEARAGDDFVLLARPEPQWTVAAFLDVWWRDVLNREKLEAMLRITALPEKWRQKVEKRLETGECEDWTRRLDF